MFKYLALFSSSQAAKEAMSKETKIESEEKKDD